MQILASLDQEGNVLEVPVPGKEGCWRCKAKQVDLLLLRRIAVRSSLEV